MHGCLGCLTNKVVHWGVGTDPPGVDFRVIIEGVGQITGGVEPLQPPGNYHTEFKTYLLTSTASVPITVFLYNAPLLCGFNVPIKG